MSTTRKGSSLPVFGLNNVLSARIRCIRLIRVLSIRRRQKRNEARSAVGGRPQPYFTDTEETIVLKSRPANFMTRAMVPPNIMPSSPTLSTEV